MREKQECLKRDLLNKDKKTLRNMQTRSVNGQINQLKDSIRALILQARSKEKKKLEVMKKLADKKKRAEM